jgi:hypothetical protein
MINILQVTFEKRAETHVGFRVKFPLLFPDFNQNWIGSTNLATPPQCEAPLKYALRFSCYYKSACGQKDRQTGRQIRKS